MANWWWWRGESEQSELEKFDDEPLSSGYPLCITFLSFFFIEKYVCLVLNMVIIMLWIMLYNFCSTHWASVQNERTFRNDEKHWWKKGCHRKFFVWLSVWWWWQRGERKHLFNENRAFNSHKKPLEKHHFNMLNCSPHRTTVKGGLALNNY